jgi:bacterial/archaeal transporter family protein
MTWISWALLSAIFAAATAILAKRGVVSIDSNLATAIRTTVILLFTWAIVWATYKPNELGKVTRAGWFFLIASGIATGLSWLFYFRALQLGPPSQVAPIDKLSVVFVMILAFLFLGETLSPLKLLGGGLIAAGAIVLAMAR